MADPDSMFTSEFRFIQVRDTGSERILSLQSLAMQKWRGGEPCDSAYVLNILNTPTEIIRRCWEHDMVRNFATFDDATQDITKLLVDAGAGGAAAIYREATDMDELYGGTSSVKELNEIIQAQWREDQITSICILSFLNYHGSVANPNTQTLKLNILTAMKCMADYSEEWHRSPYVGVGQESKQCLGLFLLKKIINDQLNQVQAQALNFKDQITQHSANPLINPNFQRLESQTSATFFRTMLEVVFNMEVVDALVEGDLVPSTAKSQMAKTNKMLTKIMGYINQEATFQGPNDIVKRKRLLQNILKTVDELHQMLASYNGTQVSPMCLVLTPHDLIPNARAKAMIKAARSTFGMALTLKGGTIDCAHTIDIHKFNRLLSWCACFIVDWHKEKPGGFDQTSFAHSVRMEANQSSDSYGQYIFQAGFEPDGNLATQQANVHQDWKNYIRDEYGDAISLQASSNTGLYTLPAFQKRSKPWADNVMQRLNKQVAAGKKERTMPISQTAKYINNNAPVQQGSGLWHIMMDPDLCMALATIGSHKVLTKPIKSGNQDPARYFLACKVNVMSQTQTVARFLTPTKTIVKKMRDLRTQVASASETDSSLLVEHKNEISAMIDSRAIGLLRSFFKNKEKMRVRQEFTATVAGAGKTSTTPFQILVLRGMATFWMSHVVNTVRTLSDAKDDCDSTSSGCGAARLQTLRGRLPSKMAQAASMSIHKTDCQMANPQLATLQIRVGNTAFIKQGMHVACSLHTPHLNEIVHIDRATNIITCKHKATLLATAPAAAVPHFSVIVGRPHNSSVGANVAWHIATRRQECMQLNTQENIKETKDMQVTETVQSGNAVVNTPQRWQGIVSPHYTDPFDDILFGVHFLKNEFVTLRNANTVYANVAAFVADTTPQAVAAKNEEGNLRVRWNQFSQKWRKYTTTKCLRVAQAVHETDTFLGSCDLDAHAFWTDHLKKTRFLPTITHDNLVEYALALAYENLGNGQAVGSAFYNQGNAAADVVANFEDALSEAGVRAKTESELLSMDFNASIEDVPDDALLARCAKPMTDLINNQAANLWQAITGLTPALQHADIKLILRQAPHVVMTTQAVSPLQKYVITFDWEAQSNDLPAVQAEINTLMAAAPPFPAPWKEFIDTRIGNDENDAPSQDDIIKLIVGMFLSSPHLRVKVYNDEHNVAIHHYTMLQNYSPSQNLQDLYYRIEITIDIT